MIAGEVRAAAQVLDAVCPGWYRRVDIKRLDMCDGNRCVLGQVYGQSWLQRGLSWLLGRCDTGYSRGQVALRRRGAYVSWLAFDGSGEQQQFWLAEIARRTLWQRGW